MLWKEHTEREREDNRGKALKPGEGWGAEAGGLEEGAWVKLWGWWTTHKVSVCISV